MKNIIISIVGVLFIFCYSHEIAFLEKGNTKSNRKILIARTVGNNFRNTVINKLIDTLGSKEYYFKNIKLSQIGKEDINQYNVILLMTAYRTQHVNVRIKRFLQKEPNRSKVIIFYTVDKDDENTDKVKPNIKVDAISSASISDRVSKRVSNLVTLIESKF